MCRPRHFGTLRNAFSARKLASRRGLARGSLRHPTMTRRLAGERIVRRPFRCRAAAAGLQKHHRVRPQGHSAVSVAPIADLLGASPEPPFAFPTGVDPLQSLTSRTTDGWFERITDLKCMFAQSQQSTHGTLVTNGTNVRFGVACPSPYPARRSCDWPIPVVRLACQL